MVIFKSEDQADTDFARKYGVWQAEEFSTMISMGDVVAIQLVGTRDPVVVGIATTEMYEDIPYAWPGKQLGFTATVKFEFPDYDGQWASGTVLI